MRSGPYPRPWPWGMMISRVLLPALSDLRSAPRLPGLSYSGECLGAPLPGQSEPAKQSEGVDKVSETIGRPEREQGIGPGHRLQTGPHAVVGRKPGECKPECGNDESGRHGARPWPSSEWPRREQSREGIGAG